MIFQQTYSTKLYSTPREEASPKFPSWMQVETWEKILCILALPWLAQLWKDTLMCCWMAIPTLFLFFTQILHSHRLLHSRVLLPYLKAMLTSLVANTEHVLGEELEKFAKNLIWMHRLQLHFFSQLGNMLLIGLLQIQRLCSVSSEIYYSVGILLFIIYWYFPEIRGLLMEALLMLFLFSI